jgi:hypothetical protein
VNVVLGGKFAALNASIEKKKGDGYDKYTHFQYQYLGRWGSKKTSSVPAWTTQWDPVPKTKIVGREHNKTKKMAKSK